MKAFEDDTIFQSIDDEGANYLENRYQFLEFINGLKETYKHNPQGFVFNEKVHDKEVFKAAKYYYYVYMPLINKIRNIQSTDSAFKHFRIFFWITDYWNGIPVDSVLEYLFGETDSEDYDGGWEESIKYLSSDFTFSGSDLADKLTCEQKDVIESAIGNQSYMNDSYSNWYLRIDGYKDANDVYDTFIHLYSANSLIESMLKGEDVTDKLSR